MKKIFYSVTAAAFLLGTTACGGDKKETAEEAQYVEITSGGLDVDLAGDGTEEEAVMAQPAFEVEEVTSSEEVTDATPTADSNEAASQPGEVDKAAVKAFIDSYEFKQYAENAKSGNIDKMIEALKWLNKTNASLKSQVRALDKTAIAKVVELDIIEKAAADKYNRMSLDGALDNLTDEMSESQLEKYNSVSRSSSLFFTMNDSKLSQEYTQIYREIKNKR